MNFRQRLEAVQQANQSMLCVGLDPDLTRFPQEIRNARNPIIAFNRAIIEATADLVCCYKPNLGFYLPHGVDGIEALAKLRSDVPAHIPVLLDAKIGDIDTTSAAYARAYFDTWNFDAVTTHPYMGYDSLQPLIEYRDRAVFVLAKTSNPGAGLLQDRWLLPEGGQEATRVSVVVARHAESWNRYGNIGLVVGGTYPDDVAAIRGVAPGLPFLIPGIGAQSADADAAVRAGLDADRRGLLVNASRSISYASSGPDFQNAAREAALGLRHQLEAARSEAAG